MTEVIVKNPKVKWFYLNKSCLDCLPASPPPRIQTHTTTTKAQWKVLGAG